MFNKVLIMVPYWLTAFALKLKYINQVLKLILKSKYRKYSGSFYTKSQLKRFNSVWLFNKLLDNIKIGKLIL